MSYFCLTFIFNSNYFWNTDRKYRKPRENLRNLTTKIIPRNCLPQELLQLPSFMLNKAVLKLSDSFFVQAYSKHLIKTRRPGVPMARLFWLHPVICLDTAYGISHLFVSINKTNAFNRTIIHFNLHRVASNLISLPWRMQIVFLSSIMTSFLSWKADVNKKLNAKPRCVIVGQV